MLGDCKECGCQCTLCNTNSLDLHHEIEVLKASLNESRQTVANLKNELKLHSEGNEAVEQRYQDQLDSHQEKYDRLLSSHRHLEQVNHDLEDKILLLVQENEKDQHATMVIHEDIHNKLKQADKRVEEVIHEKDILASQCGVVIDLLKKIQSNSSHNINSVLISKEVSRLTRAIQAHDDAHPVIPSEPEISLPKTMTMSTFPPCAVMFDNSPKPLRRHIIQTGSSMTRNYSDSRLANMTNHPTDLKLCDNCRDVSWVREIGTQTELFDSLQKTNVSRPWSKHGSAGIFDV